MTNENPQKSEYKMYKTSDKALENKKAMDLPYV